MRVGLSALALLALLPSSALPCANSLTNATHTHPSWRSFVGVPLQPVPPDRYEVTLDDGARRRAPVVPDQRSEFLQNATTPGQRQEPGFAFMVSLKGRVTQ